VPATLLCSAMDFAPKGKKAKLTVAHVVAPRIVRDNVPVKIDDVSIGDDSGWRDICPKRVNELKNDFLQVSSGSTF